MRLCALARTQALPRDYERLRVVLRVVVAFGFSSAFAAVEEAFAVAAGFLAAVTFFVVVVAFAAGAGAAAGFSS